MRNWLRYTVAMAAALVTIFTAGRAVRERSEEPRVRQVGLDVAHDATSIRPYAARAYSLWTDGRFVECLAPAHYSREEARFGPVFKLSAAPVLRSTTTAPVAPLTARRVAIAVSNGARLVTLQPGGVPTISVRKQARFPVTRAA